MAAKSWYMGAGVVNSWREASESFQTAATNADGWVVGTGSTNRSKYQTGTERAASTFDATTYPSGTLDTSLFDAIRTSLSYSGHFDAGDWTFHLVVRGVTTAGSAKGRAYVRVIRADATGANAVEITSAAGQGAEVTIAATGTDYDSSVTVTLPAFDLVNQYLFFQLAWERTGAGGMTTNDANWRTGSSASLGTRITSTNFTVDTTAPILSAQVVDTLTTAGGTPKVTTDEGNGTAYMVVVPNGDSPTVTQIKAGQQSNGTAALANQNKAVAATGQIVFNAVSGLSANTDYDCWFVHTDAAGNNSTAVKADFHTAISGTGSAAGASGTAAGTGSRSLPTFTGSASPQGAAGTAAGTGSRTPPSFSGSASAQGGSATGAATGSRSYPTWTATAAALAAAAIAAATVTFTPPSWSGTGSAQGTAATASATASRTPPSWSGTGDAQGGSGSAAATGAGGGPGARIGVGTAEGSAGSAAATASRSVPAISGTGAAQGTSSTGAATASRSLPSWSAVGSAAGQPGTAAATGSRTQPSWTGSGAAMGTSGTGAALATATGPGVQSGQGAAHGSAGIAAATGSRSIPSFTASAQAAGTSGLGAATGSQTPPTSTGVGTATGSAGQGAATATRTIPSRTGSGAAQGASGVGAATGWAVGLPGTGVAHGLGSAGVAAATARVVRAIYRSRVIASGSAVRSWRRTQGRPVLGLGGGAGVTVRSVAGEVGGIDGEAKGGTMLDERVVYLDGNGFCLDRDLETRDPDTGVWGPARGLSLSGFMSASRDGTALDGTAATVGEYASREGGYHADWPPAALAALAALVGQEVYAVLAGPTYRESFPVMVRAARVS